jgi:membrane peptidoglycan carboxypeptidase
MRVARRLALPGHTVAELFGSGAPDATITRPESWGDAPAIDEPGCPHCGRYPDDLEEADWAPPRRRLRWRRVVRRLRRLLAIVIALGVLGVLMFAGLLLITPSVSNAPALARALAQAHRAPYPGPPVPLQFAASLVATEDHRFYSEPGVDPFAVVRLVFGPLTGQPDQGGSTLYQQLGRMLYAPRWPGVTAEAEQVALGVKLAISYPKAEILQLYSDVAYFGHGYYGLDEASCGYFSVPPDRLTWPQAALLAGVVNAPSIDDPITHFAMARARQAHVLARLVASGVLTRIQADGAYRQPLHVADGQQPGCGPQVRRA